LRAKEQGTGSKGFPPGPIPKNLRDNGALDFAPFAQVAAVVLPGKGDVDGFAPFGFIEKQGIGGAAALSTT
jgi:hypothetical protein